MTLTVGRPGKVYQMTFNDEKETTTKEGPDQLSHLFYRHDLNDRDNHDQRQRRASATEAANAALMQVNDLRAATR